MDTQAQRIIDKFGSAYRLSAALKAIGYLRNPSTVYRWTYSREKGGTDGMVPTRALTYILRAARFEGVMLTPEDLDPRPR